MSHPLDTLLIVTELLIFDGDDTLWSTELLYDAARQRARQVVEGHGLDGAHWEAIERRRDVQNVAVHGMSAVRFPSSCVQALDEIAPDAAYPELRAMIWNEAASVFTAAAPPVAGAFEVLGELGQNHVLVLLTKGDPVVQQRRVRSSGLEQLLDGVVIVDEKTPTTFQNVAASRGVDPSAAVSIGNSLASDIFPAVEAGMSGIWIDAHVWEYERSRSDHVDLPTRVAVAESILDLPRGLKELALCN